MTLPPQLIFLTPSLNLRSLIAFPLPFHTLTNLSAHSTCPIYITYIPPSNTSPSTSSVSFSLSPFLSFFDSQQKLCFSIARHLLLPSLYHILTSYHLTRGTLFKSYPFLRLRGAGSRLVSHCC